MESFLEKLKKGMGIENEGSGIQVKTVPEQKKDVKKGSEEKSEGEESEKGVKKIKNRKVLKKIDVQIKTTEKEIPAGQENKIKESKIDKGWFNSQEGQLTIDLYETENEFVVQSAVAGVKPDDLDISIENDKLSIKGVRAQKVKEEGKKYLYQECYWGAFSRDVILPSEVDPSRTQALLKEGILTIRLPKIDREKKRKIEIIESE